MASFKKYFNQKKFEEEIEVDKEHPAGARYKIPLGSAYDAPLNREGLKDSYIIVDIDVENEDGGLVEPDKIGIFNYSYLIHLEKEDDGTMDYEGTFEPEEINLIFKELQNTVYMFRDHIKQEGEEFKGFGFEVDEKNAEKQRQTYEKIFGVLGGKVERKSDTKFFYRLGG
jgi:hypothetical protein